MQSTALFQVFIDSKYIKGMFGGTYQNAAREIFERLFIASPIATNREILEFIDIESIIQTIASALSINIESDTNEQIELLHDIFIEFDSLNDQIQDMRNRLFEKNVPKEKLGMSNIIRRVERSYMEYREPLIGAPTIENIRIDIKSGNLEKVKNCIGCYCGRLTDYNIYWESMDGMV